MAPTKPGGTVFRTVKGYGGAGLKKQYPNDSQIVSGDSVPKLVGFTITVLFTNECRGMVIDGTL